MENSTLVLNIVDRQGYLAACYNIHQACLSYVAHEPVMSDADYDSIKDQLAAWEAANPSEVVAWSPVGKVLGGVNDGVTPNNLAEFMTAAMMGTGDGNE